jgi:hypothetical protein
VIAFEVTAGLAPEDQVIDSPPETLQSGDAVRLAEPLPKQGGPLRRNRPSLVQFSVTISLSRNSQLRQLRLNGRKYGALPGNTAG